MIYLDNAATTRVCEEAAAAAMRMMTEQFGNPSATYKLGREAKAAVDAARAQVASALGCKPDEVYFTSCGSEGDNWALLSGARSMQRKGKHIISSVMEHDAIRKTLDVLEKEGFEVTRLSPAADGSICVEAVKAGKLDEKLVDRACERILNIVYRYLENAKPETPWDKEAQHAQAADIAAECMVLLKNEGGILPLKKEDDIAFIGEFAKKPRFQGGGSSHINCFKITGALAAAEGLKVTYARGYDVAADDAPAEMIAEAVAAAKKAKAAVVFAGLPDSYESEGYDRAHMRMPACQNKLIEAVAEANPNTVVVLHNGAPVEMPWIGKVKAVLEAYLGGQAVGEAAVRVLFGDANPCGKLPETFPLKLEDNPSYLYYGGEGNVTEYREGVFVGYRYYDKKKMDVLFPFGFGLSYTTFEYSGLKLSAGKIKDTDTLTVTLTVKNTGSRAGKEAVQLYVGDVESTPLRPVRELKGFAKVALEPGESKAVSFTLDKRSFAYWNQQIHDWHVETGVFTVEVGGSSRDLPLKAEVTVESTVELPRRYTRDSIFMDIMADPKAAPVMKDFMKQTMEIFGHEETEQDTKEAAKEAISEDMTLAMMQYMPLRGAMSFGGGADSSERMESLLKKLNGEA